MTDFKELQVVKLRRPVWVVAELHGNAINIRTELPTGLVGTIVDLNPLHPDKAYVECLNPDGNGFLFVVDLSELEHVNP